MKHNPVSHLGTRFYNPPTIDEQGAALTGIVWQGYCFVHDLTTIEEAAVDLGYEIAFVAWLFQGLQRGEPQTFNAWIASNPALGIAWGRLAEDMEVPDDAGLAVHDA